MCLYCNKCWLFKEKKNRVPALMELQFYGETDIFRNDTGCCIIIETSIQKDRNVFLRSREQDNFIYLFIYFFENLI